MLKIIYVEDNVTDFEMARAILEEEGMLGTMLRVEKESDLIAALSEGDFDIVLSDYNLPAYHGLEVLSYLSKEYPDLPVIIVTGNLSDEIAVDLIKKGAWDYVLKENIYRLIPSIKYSLELRKMRVEREVTLKNLRESETNYRVLAESSPYGILVHCDGLIQYYNKEAETIISGKKNGNAIGKKILDYILPEDRKIIEKKLQKLHSGGSIKDPYEIKYINSTGKLFYFEVASSAIMYKGKPAVQVIFRDIAERKKVEQQIINAKNKAIEADQLKTAFLENMSHEIRTPLNGILGFTSLLKFKNISIEDRDNYIKIIENSGKHLLTIIDDLIQISQIETGQIELKTGDFNLNSLMDEVFVFFNDGEKYKNLPILLVSVKALKNNDSYIISDRARLKQVLFNLISNAYKFTPEGRIEFGYKLLDDKKLLFYVKDTGIGISSKTQELIFERFRQADETTTRTYGGNGLGLSISKGILTAMKGRIWVESVIDQGSCFNFEFPYVVAENEIHINKINNGMISENRNWIGKTFLIAEDELTNFTLLKHILLSTGAEILHAVDGFETLELIDKHEKIDLILLDVKMPKMDGYETIKKIRANNFKIPVIAQTAYVMNNDIQNLLDDGCNDYILKPINANELLEKINRYL